MPLTFQPYKPASVPEGGDPATAVYLGDELERIGNVLGALTAAVDGIDIPEPPDAPQGLVPPGLVAAWASDAAPLHWLACDGALLLVADWPLLGAVLGAIYGGDGVTDFAVPDYRGEFLRGTDAGAGRDPDAGARTDRGDGTAGDAVGTRQLHALEDHTHTYNSPTAGATRLESAGSTNIGITETSGPNDALVSADETRGRNVNTDWLIYAGVPA